MSTNRIAVVLFMFVFSTYAEEKYGGAPNAFYQVQITPREVALGGGGVSYNSGAFAALVNPAGLSIIPSRGLLTVGAITTSHYMQYRNPHAFNSQDYTYNAAAIQIFPENISWVIGILGVLRETKGIIGTRLDQFDEIYETGLFDLDEGMLLVSVAKNYDGLRLGSSIHTAYRSMLNDYSRIYLAGFDFGLRYSVMNYFPEGTGRILDDIEMGTIIRFERDRHTDQNQASLGVSLYTHPLMSMMVIHLTASLHTGDYMENKWYTGGELKFGELIAFRIGTNSAGALSGGIGVVQAAGRLRLQLDLAYTLLTWKGYDPRMQLVDYPIKMAVSFSF